MALMTKVRQFSRLATDTLNYMCCCDSLWSTQSAGTTSTDKGQGPLQHNELVVERVDSHPSLSGLSYMPVSAMSA